MRRELRQLRLRAGRRSTALRLALWVTVATVLANTVVFSSASFTSNRTGNPGNTLASGTLRILSTKDGQAVIDNVTMRPGQTSSGTLTLTNDGSVSSQITVVQAAAPADVPTTPALSAALTLIITDSTSGAELWRGAMNALTTPAPLATLAPGGSQGLTITLDFPAAAADPLLQGATTSLTLRFAGASP